MVGLRVKCCVLIDTRMCRVPKLRIVLGGTGDALAMLMSFIGASMLSGPLVLLLNNVWLAGLSLRCCACFAGVLLLCVCSVVSHCVV